MMHTIRRLFLHDMGRKILSLLLAALVWSLVSKQIVEDGRVVLRIEEVTQTPRLTRNTLEVHPPEGWLLAQPSPGTEISIRLRGPRQNIADFASDDPAAFFVASFVDPGSGLSSHSVQVLPRDLVWRHPDDARALLAPDQPGINLVFERKLEAELTLSSKLVQVSGRPDENHELLLEFLSLDTNAVTFHGPYSKLRRLMDQIHAWEADPAHVAAPEVLEPLRADDAREDIKQDLGLSPRLGALRIRMDPPTVGVTLPVRLKTFEPVHFIQEKLITLGEAPGKWRAEWKAQPWIATLEARPELGSLDFSETWVRQHLTLFVDLRRLPQGAAEFDLPVEWSLSGIDDEKERELLYRSLHVNPAPGSDAVVRMTAFEQKP